jgi:glycosyltransferase involved in cell wall biosynthesis
VSNQTADQLAAIGPSRDTIRVIPNGISIEEIQSIPATSDGFDVLFAGRLIADKNVDMLLAAFDEVADHHGATLGIVGNGPQFDALVRQATQLRHSEKVSFLGFLDEYEDVLAHMHAADVFASPSTREGFGITLIEAMAANCTVIGVEHEGSAVSEVIGEGGFVTEFSVEALADALDDALAGRRPPHDPQTVVAQYDWEVVAQRAERVYADVLEKSVHADTEGCLNVSP